MQPAGSAQNDGSVHKAETKIALRVARKFFRGNKIKEEIDLKQHLESNYLKRIPNRNSQTIPNAKNAIALPNSILKNAMSPTARPPTITPPTNIQTKTTLKAITQGPTLPSVNFLKVNRIKLKQQEKEMLERKAQQNRTTKDFRMKQFAGVTSKYMSAFKDHVQRSKFKQVHSRGTIRTTGTKIFRKNVSRPVVINRIILSSGFMDLYETVKIISPRTSYTENTY